MQVINLAKEIAVPHLEHFNSELLNQVDHGGRAGYKSRKNALKIAKRMLEDKHCETMVVRQDYIDHRDSTFRDLIWAFKKLGVKLKETVHYPKGETSTLYIRLPNGGYIHFKQMKSIDKVKGTRPHNDDNQIKIIWYFEITEFKSKWYIDESNATHVRGGGKDYMWCLYEFNDAPKLSHWTYDFITLMEQDPNAYVKKTNYNDAPLWQQHKFLGDIYLHMIEALKKIDPNQYRSTYLGFPANLTGTVYKQFSRARNVKPATHKYQEIIVGVDVGGADATTFTMRGIKEHFSGMEIPKHYYHKNGVSGGIKTINDYVNDFLDFCEKIYMQYHQVITVYIDNAALMFIQLVEDYSYQERYLYIDIKPLPKMKRLKGVSKDKSILQGRADMNEIMFGSGYCTIDPSCTELIKALEEREYNKKGLPADDGSSNVDSIDSYDYTWLVDMDTIYDIILR